MRAKIAVATIFFAAAILYLGHFSAAHGGRDAERLGALCA
jgi:hypothetical protein